MHYGFANANKRPWHRLRTTLRSSAKEIRVCMSTRYARQSGDCAKKGSADLVLIRTHIPSVDSFCPYRHLAKK
jgi:hypothetical protein